MHVVFKNNTQCTPWVHSSITSISQDVTCCDRHWSENSDYELLLVACTKSHILILSSCLRFSNLPCGWPGHHLLQTIAMVFVITFTFVFAPFVLDVIVTFMLLRNCWGKHASLKILLIVEHYHCHLALVLLALNSIIHWLSLAWWPLQEFQS